MKDQGMLEERNAALEARITMLDAEIALLTQMLIEAGLEPGGEWYRARDRASVSLLMRRFNAKGGD